MADATPPEPKINKEEALRIASEEPIVQTFMGDIDNLRQVVLENLHFWSVIYRARDVEAQHGFQLEVKVCKKTGRVTETHAHPVNLR
ncbi:hypothetical protein [Acanthopleuribacter pedis]|uniref:Uncharacterized protein n=1 Tax=Acanthopleuribacter pedis TaxID=442870 RepID=A0A8J7U0J8_9BACT|nr:hypothetical protein [Acanthopleuribacter pedis]MBO1317148.1 hypothetical protein [Acanthopleuribacter pedis]